MKKTLLIFVVIATLACAEFTKSGDIVTDSATSLQWQDDEVVKTTFVTWQTAIDHCEDLTLGGHSDWRLPNIRELNSIIDRNKIDVMSSVFQYSFLQFYWSSSTSITGVAHYGIYSFDGHYFFDGSSNRHYVRCVR